jgi:hypothetical protein
MVVMSVISATPEVEIWRTEDPDQPREKVRTYLSK